MPSSFQMEFGGTSLDAKPTIGSRLWNVDRFGRLIGQYGFIWRPGENKATCNRDFDWDRIATDIVQGSGGGLWSPYNPASLKTFVGDFSNDFPVREGCTGAEPHCECGFYAYYDEKVLPQSGKTSNQPIGAVGVVEGYGKVSIGPRGFRAMRSRILAVCLGELNRSISTVVLDSLTSPAPRPGSINKDQVQHNYPDVSFFGSTKEMYAEFPPGQPPLLDPNAPGFWEREVEW